MAREYFCKEEMIRISQDDVVPLPNVMECYWNEEAFTRDYSWVHPDNGVLTGVVI